MSNYQNVDTGVESDDQEDFDDVHLEVRRYEIQKMLSKPLYDRLEIFTAPQPKFEHVLNPSCKQCSKCKLCMEEGGQTYVERSQTEAFKAHLWRVPNQKGNYHYEIEYIVDPTANSLPDNYMVNYQEEFTARLTKGLVSNYWKILDEKEALELRNPQKTGGH